MSETKSITKISRRRAEKKINEQLVDNNDNRWTKKECIIKRSRLDYGTNYRRYRKEQLRKFKSGGG